MRNHFEGIYPPRVPQEQFPRPHYTDHRTHGLSRPGAAQLLQHHGGAAAERDWSPLWIIAGILKKPAKKAPTNGQEKPTKAEVKEAKEKLKGPPEFPKGPKPLYEDVSPGEIFVAMRPTKQGKKGGDKKDGKDDKAKTDKISKPTPKKSK
eukprot:tig00021761_g23445.t1